MAPALFTRMSSSPASAATVRTAASLDRSAEIVRTFTCRRARIPAAAASSAACSRATRIDVAAFVGQHLGRSAADALRAAGDQRRLATQFQIHLMPPFAIPPDRPGTPRQTRGRSPGSPCRRRNAHSGCHCTPSTQPRVSGGAHRLDGAVGRHRLHHQAGRQRSIACAVQRVHQDLRRPDHAGQAAGQRHQVRGAVALLERAAPAAMVEAARLGMDRLEQRAAERHVQLLDAAADRQDGDASGDSLGDQRAGWWRRAPGRADQGSGFRRRRSGRDGHCSGCRAAAGRRAGPAPPIPAHPAAGS